MANNNEQTPHLIMTSSPHIRGSRTTRSIMLDVLIALTPVAIAATLIYGTRTLLILAVAILTAILTEGIGQKLMGRPQTIGDLSAVVTACILSFNLPIDMPLWQVAIGALFAIAIVKLIFGGLGQNFMNPAAGARVALLASFGGSFVMSSKPVQWVLEAIDGVSAATVDAASSASPLSILKQGSGAISNMPEYKHMLFGTHQTFAIGETAIIAILIGGAYLLIRGVIKWQIPLSILTTVAVASYFYGGFNLDFVAYQLLSGGVMFAAFFMATDYATSPLTNKGKIIFGISLGLLACFIRFWGSMPEGVAFAIIIMNILTPHIDRWTVRRAFGSEKKEPLKSLEEAK